MVDRPQHDELTTAQRSALDAVRRAAGRRREYDRARLVSVLDSTGSSVAAYESALETVRERARVVVHFHPDRIAADGRIVARGLLEDGVYRNQFETKLSAGSRSAHEGGERDRWEQALFDAAYQAPGTTPFERPKYGSLELVRHPDGPAPRFGSCYFVLDAAVSHRTTFTFAGSEQPEAVERAGTIDELDGVMVALLEEVAAARGATVAWPPFVVSTLGLGPTTVTALLERITRELSQPRHFDAAQPPGRVLDSCIEAQIHGTIDLRRDVDTVVIDPSFRGTATGEAIDRLCRTHAIDHAAHGGFRLDVARVPDDFRGPAMPRLAERVARDGILHAAAIGIAEAELRADPSSFGEHGSFDEVLQQLKQLWHVLVHFGRTIAN